MTDPPPVRAGTIVGERTPGSGVWVVLPTYQEAENIGPIAAAVLEALPGATLLVVDDGSPDGTGRLADEMASADPCITGATRSALLSTTGPISAGRTAGSWLKSASIWTTIAAPPSIARPNPSRYARPRPCFALRWRTRTRSSAAASSSAW